MKKENQKKIFVGMSGGVDSSVSAALLKEAGHSVTGVFIKVWSPDFMECTWKEDRQDALRVAALLDIPFLTLDFEEEYKKHVVDYMVNEYRVGRTPNPDVMCNKYIKFDSFLNHALKEGADAIATGHYAQIKKDDDGYTLERGKDENKDQSYFLWTLKQEILKNIYFPVGEYKKQKVRELAEHFNLPVADKKDSQGLCFLGKIDMRDFLENYIETHRGNVLDERGGVIGEHIGVEFYTIGQRHGFTINKKHTNDPPFYVISKAIADNTITVSETSHRIQEENTICVTNTNWIKGRSPEINKSYEVQSRYRQTPLQAELIETQEERARFKVDDSSFLTPPGQSLVVYSGNECLGGGIIED